MMNKGNVIIISGPSGSGKDTLIQGILKKLPDLRFSISSITRQMREGEINGEKYNFISRELFEKMLAKDEFLEHNTYVGNYYGTPKSPVVTAIENGYDMLIEVDVNGAEQIREKLPDAISIFIMPPTFEELKNRLSNRGTETQEIIEKRMKSSLNEIKRAEQYDYIVVNDNIETAVNDIMYVILSQRLKTDKKRNIINEVLSKC